MVGKKEDVRHCLKNFFRSLDDMVFVLDESKRFTLFHAPHKEMLFVEPEKFMGVPYSKVLPKDVTQIIDAVWEKVMSGKVADFEYSAFIHGKERWFSGKMCKASSNCAFGGVVAVIRDITKMKDDEQALERNYAELKKLDDLKSTILRDVSHELKTPISMINLSAKMIEHEYGKDAPSKEVVSKYIEISKRNSARLSAYVDSIVSLSLLRSSVKTEKKRLDLTEVLEQVIREMRPFAQDKGLVLDFCFGKDCFVFANRMQMLMLFRNLVDNAIKFTRKGVVGVSCAKDKDSVSVLVKDTGKGIRKQDLEIIFASFSKLDKGGDGLGIGLSIVKNVVKLHDGKIVVESRVGKGSEFRVTLPRCKR